MAEKQKTFTLLPKVLNGGIAGVIGVLCTFPLDLVKTRLQNQVIGPDGRRMYTGIPDALVKTFKKEGFFGMYQGVKINLAGVFPERAIQLACNDMFRFKLKNPDGSLPLPRQLLAAALTACVQMSVTVPMELIKIQMQDQGRLAKISKKSTGLNTLEVIFYIIRKNGPLGLYKGLGTTLIRDILFCMIYFPLFAALNESCPKTANGEAKLWCSFSSGLVSGGTAAWLVTPCDVVKTRLQTLVKKKGEIVYRSIPAAYITIFRQEGFRALFKGGACRVMVISPLFGVSQAVYFLGIAEWILGVERNT